MKLHESDLNEINENDPDLKELLSVEFDVSNKLKDIIKKIRNSGESKYQLNSYLFLLDNLSKEFRINWIYLGNQIVRNIGRLENSHQIEILNYILSKIDNFSNKQLATLYMTLTKIMRRLELKAIENVVPIPQSKKIRKVRHQIYQEMSKKSRYIENSTEDIKLKYFENPQEAIQQLVNKNQFLNDLKVITNNLDKFTKEQLGNFFNFMKKGILKYIINQFSVPEINKVYSQIDEIPEIVKIRNKKNLLKYVATRGDPFYELKIEDKRISELENCIICKKNLITEEYRPLCKICFDEKTSDFPDRHFPREHAFNNFSTLFDNHYQKYDKNLGYITVEIDLPFESQFTVIDIEATGDITKDRTHFITTMGFLNGKKAFIYQLIDFSKHKEFTKACRKASRNFKKPVIAYNFEGSEKLWLRISEGGWIDIQKKRKRINEESGEHLDLLKLKEVSFEWDDISGLECVDQCKLYQKTGDITHIKVIAYHNFIDILREYYVGLVDLKVHDYLEGMIWNPLVNQLTIMYSCSVCYNEFYSKNQLNNHLSSHKD
ncbi:MAG: hypothetical protein ACW96X_07875 [Promethearchaeota archaeon]|jgi:hypothetical protein